jgi:hypothetical protein
VAVTDPTWLTEYECCWQCLHGDHARCTGTAHSTRLSQRNEVPCRCAGEGHPVAQTCCIFLSGRSVLRQRCGKPAKGTRPLNRLSNAAEVPACGVHLAAYRREEANERQRAADAEARAERYKRAAERRDASAVWAARLVDEFGVSATACRDTNAPCVLVLVDPEQLYDLLLKGAGR